VRSRNLDLGLSPDLPGVAEMGNRAKRLVRAGSQYSSFRHCSPSIAPYRAMDVYPPGDLGIYPAGACTRSENSPASRRGYRATASAPSPNRLRRVDAARATFAFSHPSNFSVRHPVSQ